MCVVTHRTDAMRDCEKIFAESAEAAVLTAETAPVGGLIVSVSLPPRSVTTLVVRPCI